MRNRAYRRFQLEKKKHLAKKIYPHDLNATWANHLQGCSCYLCGNPRKWFRMKDMQELRAYDVYKVYITEQYDELLF